MSISPKLDIHTTKREFIEKGYNLLLQMFMAIHKNANLKRLTSLSRTSSPSFQVNLD